MRRRRPATEGLLLAVLVGAAPACTSVSDDDSGRFEVSWSLLAAANDEAVSSCPEGTIAQVVSTLPETGEEFLDCFPCDDFSGVTEELPLGSYAVRVEIIEADLEQCGLGSPPLAARSSEQAADLVAEDQQIPLDFDFYADGGFFRVAWTLSDGSGEELACGEAQQGGVRVVSTPEGGGSELEDRFVCSGDGTCEDQCGTSEVLPLGTYDVAVELLDENDNPLVSCDELESRTVEFGNQLVDLGMVDCPIQ